MEFKIIDLMENADASEITPGGAVTLDTERIKALTLQKIRPRPGKRIAPRLLVAAVIAAALAASALAAAGFRKYGSPTDMLEGFYGNTRQDSVVDQKAPWGDLPDSQRVALDPEAAGQAGPFIADVGRTVKEGSLTLTVHGNLYDSVTGCGIVCYTLEDPNGIACETDYDGMVHGIPVYGGTRHGYAYLLKGSADTRLDIAEYYIRSPHDKENYIELGLSMPVHSQKDEFALKQQAIQIPLEDGGGMEGLWSGGIRLSPIGIALDGAEMDFLAEAGGTDSIKSLEIHFRDGSSYIVLDENQKNYVFGACSDQTHLVMPFNRLVDVKQVTGVRVNGHLVSDLKPIPDSQRLRYGPYVDRRGQLDREGSISDGSIRFDNRVLTPVQVRYSDFTKIGFIDCSLSADQPEKLMENGHFIPWQAGLQSNLLIRWECLAQEGKTLKLRGYFVNLEPDVPSAKLWFEGSKADPRLDTATENLICLPLESEPHSGRTFADGTILLSDLGMVIDYEALQLHQGSTPKNLSLTLEDGTVRTLSSWDEEILDCTWLWTGELRDSTRNLVYVGFPEPIPAEAIESITYAGHTFKR